MTESLVEPSRRFIDDVTAALTEVSRGVTGLRTDKLGQDVALEAFNLVCGLVAIDRRVSDDELWEVLGAFGPLLETQLAGATPDALPRLGPDGRTAHASPTSRRRCSRCCSPPTGAAPRPTRARYYTAAVEIAFAVAAIDLHTSDTELAAIERFRGMLLGAIEAMEQGRRPAVVGAASGPAAPAAHARERRSAGPPDRRAPRRARRPRGPRPG